jgi:limonene-1,2-epoxide hydrolase
VTNGATSGNQMFSVEDQLKNAHLVRQLFERWDGGGSRFDKLLSPNVRIFFDSNPTDLVVREEGKVHIGPEAMKSIAEAYASKGFSYDFVIHDIFTCGPVVVVSRTDIRKEDGKPDKPVPVVGVFAFKNGEIVEWSEYYR